MTEMRSRHTGCCCVEELRWDLIPFPPLFCPWPHFVFLFPSFFRLPLFLCCEKHSVFVMPYPEAVFSVGACTSPLTTCLKEPTFYNRVWKRPLRTICLFTNILSFFLFLRTKMGFTFFFPLSSNKMENTIGKEVLWPCSKWSLICAPNTNSASFLIIMLRPFYLPWCSLFQVQYTLVQYISGCKRVLLGRKCELFAGLSHASRKEKVIGRWAWV